MQLAALTAAGLGDPGRSTGYHCYGLPPFTKWNQVIGNTRGKVPQSFNNHAVSSSHHPTDSAPVDNVWGLMKDIDNSLSQGPLNLLHYVVLGRKEVITKVVLVMFYDNSTQ